jgi:hypothetical protein
LNVDRLMSKVLHHATANGVNKVAVMCCGPHGLVSEAKCKAAKYETNDVKFDFHNEYFGCESSSFLQSI